MPGDEMYGVSGAPIALDDEYSSVDEWVTS